jgi:hypothetical protein
MSSILASKKRKLSEESGSENDNNSKNESSKSKKTKSAKSDDEDKEEQSEPTQVKVKKMNETERRSAALNRMTHLLKTEGPKLEEASVSADNEKKANQLERLIKYAVVFTPRSIKNQYEKDLKVKDIDADNKKAIAEIFESKNFKYYTALMLQFGGEDAKNIIKNNDPNKPKKKGGKKKKVAEGSENEEEEEEKLD